MSGGGFFESIRADGRHHGSWLDAVLALGFWASSNYRVARWLHDHHLDLLARIVQATGALIVGSDISRKAEIGPGLMISHPNGIFIGPGAVLGSDCVLTQGCAIMVDTWGARDESAYPTLEDRVYVGAGAKILGGIIVHHDARISPNSVVLKDVPINATALGVPARILDFEFRHRGG